MKRVATVFGSLLAAMPPYFDEEGYLDAWEAVAKEKLEAFKPDHVVLRYHGLPERQIKKGNPSGIHCLETLEAIGMQAKESFLEHGGEEFELIPSLNTHPKWVAAMADLIEAV